MGDAFVIDKSFQALDRPLKRLAILAILYFIGRIVASYLWGI